MHEIYYATKTFESNANEEIYVEVIKEIGKKKKIVANKRCLDLINKRVFDPNNFIIEFPEQLHVQDNTIEYLIEKDALDIKDFIHFELNENTWNIIDRKINEKKKFYKTYKLPSGFKSNLLCNDCCESRKPKKKTGVKKLKIKIQDMENNDDVFLFSKPKVSVLSALKEKTKEELLQFAETLAKKEFSLKSRFVKMLCTELMSVVDFTKALEFFKILTPCLTIQQMVVLQQKLIINVKRHKESISNENIDIISWFYQTFLETKNTQLLQNNDRLRVELQKLCKAKELTCKLGNLKK